MKINIRKDGSMSFTATNRKDSRSLTNLVRTMAGHHPDHWFLQRVGKTIRQKQAAGEEYIDIAIVDEAHANRLFLDQRSDYKYIDVPTA